MTVYDNDLAELLETPLTVAQKRGAEAIETILAGIGPAVLAELAVQVANLTGLSAFGDCLRFPSSGMRRLMLASALKKMVLPPYDAGLVAEMSSSTDRLWSTVGRAVGDVRAAWVEMGGD